MPHLKVQDTEIYYEVHGDGPPFLFCSVTGLDHQAWKFHQVREFSRDHKVIVFDYRGTGKSSKAVQKYSIKMFTDDAAAILDHLGRGTSDRLRPLHGWGRGATAGTGSSQQGEETHPCFQRLFSSWSEGHSSCHVPRHGSHGLRGLHPSAHH